MIIAWQASWPSYTLLKTIRRTFYEAHQIGYCSVQQKHIRVLFADHMSSMSQMLERMLRHIAGKEHKCWKECLLERMLEMKLKTHAAKHL